MSQLQIQLDRIRRRWVLILVIGIVAAAGALGAAAVQGTTYTGRATLTIVSPDRAPEQDTPLAQGYADIFNQTSSQQELRDQAGVTADVTLNARIAAASPIVYVEATGRDAAQAQDAATKMAVALRDQINSGVGRGDTDQQRQQLTRDLAAAQARGDNGAISRIQGDIRDLDAGGTNELRDLQLNAGVAPNSTNAVRNAGAALAGGLLFGIALALALGRFENRIVTPNEVRDRLGLPVLAEVNGGKRRGDKGDARSALLHSLMGLTDAYGMPSPGTLAITGPKSTRATKSKVAIAIAGLRALQGQQTLLLQTDLDGEGTARELADLNGVAEFLAERTGARVDGKVFSNGRALLVGPPGRRRNDVFALYSKPHMQRLLQQGIALADLVIVDAPPAETVEGQIVCGTADRSLLVVEEGQTRARDATGALDSLQRVGSTALGVVLVRNPAQLNDGGFLSEGPWNPVALPPPPNKPAPSAPSAAPAASTPAPAAAAATPVVQYQPANRTQPITREKLDEARAAAAARESAANNAAAAGPTNGAGHGSANGTNGTNGVNGTNGGTNGATNGAALGAAAGLAAAAGAAGAASSAPSAPAGPPTPGRGSGDGGPKNGDNGSSGAPDGRGAARPGAPSPTAGPAGPASGPTPSPRPQPSPGSGDKRPSPTPSAPKPGGPAGTGPSASGPTGAGPAAKAGAAAGTAAAGAAPSNGKPGQGAAGPKPGGPNAGQTTNGGQNTNGGQGNGAPKAQPTPGPGPNAPSGPASPAGSSGSHPRPGGPAPQAGSPSPAPQATAQGQQKAPSSPEQGAGAGPNVRRPAGGARPSPRPKPSPSGSGPSPSGSGPSASAGQAGATGASAGSPSRAASPSPAGSKRIGTARFVDGATPHSANGGAANGGSRPSAGGANGTTGTNGGSTPGGAAPGGGDRLAAPTVTMRPEK